MPAEVISLDNWKQTLALHKDEQVTPSSDMSRYKVCLTATDTNGVVRVLDQQRYSESQFDLMICSALSWKKIFIFGDPNGLVDISATETLKVEISRINDSGEPTDG